MAAFKVQRQRAECPGLAAHDGLAQDHE